MAHYFAGLRFSNMTEGVTIQGNRSIDAHPGSLVGAQLSSKTSDTLRRQAGSNQSMRMIRTDETCFLNKIYGMRTSNFAASMASENFEDNYAHI